jgi:hypothetical protein
MHGAVISGYATGYRNPGRMVNRQDFCNKLRKLRQIMMQTTFKKDIPRSQTQKDMFSSAK